MFLLNSLLTLIEESALVSGALPQKIPGGSCDKSHRGPSSMWGNQEWPGRPNVLRCPGTLEDPACLSSAGFSFFVCGELQFRIRD